MSPRVLVVDDEPDVVELLSYNFRSAGAEVRSAGDGPQAVAAATSWLPDAIVLDLDLPFLDGLSVCEMLRKMPAMRTTPILMLTGWSSSQTQQLAAEEQQLRAQVVQQQQQNFAKELFLKKLENLVKRKPKHLLQYHR